MNMNLMNFKLVLEQAEMELQRKALSQGSNSIEYEEAKTQYEIAARAYVKQINEFCDDHDIKITLDINFYNSNQYDR